MRVKSFTLIELLVTISIAVLLIAASYPIFAREAGGSSVEREAESIASFILRAKNYSYNPEDENADSYLIKVHNAGKKLVLYRKILTPPSETPFDSFVLSKPTITSSNNDEITFSVKNKEISFSQPVTETLWTVTVKNKKAEIKINKSGSVDVEPI